MNTAALTSVLSLDDPAGALQLLRRARRLTRAGGPIGARELIIAALDTPWRLGLEPSEAEALRSRLYERPDPSPRALETQRQQIAKVVSRVGDADHRATARIWISAALEVWGEHIPAVLEYRSRILRHLQTRTRAHHRLVESARSAAARPVHSLPVIWRSTARRAVLRGRSAARLIRGSIPYAMVEAWRGAASRLLFIVCLPAILAREGLRMLCARFVGSRLRYGSLVETTANPDDESWHAGSGTRLVVQLLPPTVLLLLGIFETTNVVLALGLGDNALPVVNLLAAGAEASGEQPSLGVLMLAILGGDDWLLRWFHLGAMIAWLPAYRQVEELTWVARGVPFLGPVLHWAVWPLRSVLWVTDVAARRDAGLRGIVAAVVPVGIARLIATAVGI